MKDDKSQIAVKTNVLNMTSTNLTNNSVTILAGSSSDITINLTNSSSIEMYYRIMHEGVPTGVSIYEKNGDNTSFGSIDANGTNTSILTINNTTSENVTIKFLLQESNVSQFDKEVGTSYVNVSANFDHSGAHVPMLPSNMIPVYYVPADSETEEGTWHKADVNNADSNYIWYDYDNGRWANIVLVNEYNRYNYLYADNGTIIDEGEPTYTERGFVYATTHNPMVDSDTKVVASGKGRGEFVANATDLVVGNTYYIRAYATNSQGTAYGEEKVADFKAIPPQVTTVSVEFKSNTSAYFIGKITNVGDPEYTERGFIYGTMQTPMIDDDAVTKVVVAKNTSAQFEKQITNANWGNHLWYIRAYAISSAGVSYGEIKTIQDPEYAEYLTLPTFDYAGYLPFDNKYIIEYYSKQSKK